MNNRLNELEIETIKRQAREKLGECRKTNDVIGPQIFSILGLYARVIYYPLGKDAPWGFTRISGSQNDSELEKPFVAINTSIPVECQIFAAAHELYHIWYEKNPDILPPDLLNEQDKKINEKKANRFAAEFLVDEIMLKQEAELYKIKDITIKAVLQLADLFKVPYQAMAKRLHETGFIGEKELENFLSESETSILKYRKIYALFSLRPDKHIAMDNLVELADHAFKKGLITYEKLEYILELCGLKPEEIGIEKRLEDVFPSDEELDSIMEEDVSGR